MKFKFFLFSISLTLIILFANNIKISCNVGKKIASNINNKTASETYLLENDLKSENIDYNKPCYILTPNTMEFHLIDCKTLNNLQSYEWKGYLGDSAGLMNHGYRPCSICSPFSELLPEQEPQPEYLKLKY